MKLSELIAIRKALPMDATKASIQTRFKIVRFLKATETDAEFYENEASKIIADCAEKDEKNQILHNESGIPIAEDKKELFISRMAELDNTKANCPKLRLSMDEADKLELSVEKLLVLNDFIKEAEE